MIIDNHNHVGLETAGYLGGQFPYAQSLPDLDLKASATPVTHALVFPFVSYPSASAPDAVCPPTETPMAQVPYALANQNLLKELRCYAGKTATRFAPVAILDPARDAEAQVAHIRELHGRHPFRALKIQGTIIRSEVTALLRQGRPFLDLARELDLPFLIHSSVHPDDVWSQAHDILEVAEATPDVRFLLAHSCRFQKSALDRIAALPNAWFDCSAHRIHCALAAEDAPAVAPPDDRFPSDYTRPAAVLRDLADAYPDKFIWGSDSPYYSWAADEGDVPETLLSDYASEWACVAELPPDTITRITRTNTLDWLKRDADSF